MVYIYIYHKLICSQGLLWSKYFTSTIELESYISYVLILFFDMSVWLDEVVTNLCFAAIAFKYASSPCNNLKKNLEKKECSSN